MRREDLKAALDSLEKAGWGRAEVFAKRSRVRRFGVDSSGETTVLSEEMGWSARAGSAERSFFVAHSGTPCGLSRWPPAAAGGLRLPPSAGLRHWRSPPDLDTPLLGEGEGHRVLREIAQSLESDSGRARMIGAQLEDAAGEAAIRSSEGVDSRYRSRLATLRVEVELPKIPGSKFTLALASRSAASFPAKALGRRLADVVHVRSEGVLPQSGGKQFLLSPEVASHLLGYLSPVFVGAGETGLEERDGRVGSACVVLIEDGGYAAGPIAAPFDGEGVANARRVLVDRGVPGERILPWWSDSRPRGSHLRRGWRDRPQLGASQVVLEASDPVPVAALLSEVRCGYYLIESPRVGSVDFTTGEFSLPVCGFNVVAGRPVSPLADVLLRGNLRTFMHGVVGSARDLSFHAREAIIGSPTLLAEGLELGGR